MASQIYHLQIRLPNIAGIDKGTEVLYKGYKAGMVDRITIAYDPELVFVVRLSIKREIKLNVGTTLTVRNKGFGGSKFIELMPPADGGSQAVLQEDAVLLSVPDRDLTTKANEVLEEVQKIVRDLQKSGTVDQIARTVNIAQSAVVNLDRVLANTNALLEENRAALQLAVKNIAGITARTDELLTKKDAALQQTVENLNQSTSHLPFILMNIEELTADVKLHPWHLLRKGKEGPPVTVDHHHPPAATKNVIESKH
jgi:ABC-type transporter Mla subunit MlaD